MLSRHAVRAIATKQSVADEVTLQVVDLQVFSEQDMKKGIKARLQLSDGDSKLTCMVVDKAWHLNVSFHFVDSAEFPS